jgi:hypothetical protein
VKQNGPGPSLGSPTTYKVQTQTDSIMHTMGPLPDDPAPAYSITKVALNNGTYEITFRGGYDNLIGCIPTVAESRLSFADFVTGGTPAPTTMVWAGKDHRRTSNNLALVKQSQTDHDKCQTDASKNGEPGNPAFENTLKACERRARLNEPDCLHLQHRRTLRKRADV